MHLSELKAMHIGALITMGEALEIDNVARLRKQELMFAIMKKRAKGGEQVFGDGVLEVLPDGFGFLRAIDESYMASTDDIYLSPSQIRRFGMRKGDYLKGATRPAASNEKYPALLRLDEINGFSPEEARTRPRFEDLTPLFPDEKLRLEVPGDTNNMVARIVDLISPIGKGQRGLI
ncbi:MAG: Rho termination factor N-terminal domain-containing protein, partial [Vitreoscilla sp.]